jgi:hypothetical protein
MSDRLAHPNLFNRMSYPSTIKLPNKPLLTFYLLPSPEMQRILPAGRWYPAGIYYPSAEWLMNSRSRS